MNIIQKRMIAAIRKVGIDLMPFAEAASVGLPLGRLLRLSLFQVAGGMAMVLMVGTLNRVMIVELGVSATFVALMIALPVMIAPFRALIGFKSDHHTSALGWRRVPYIWIGSLMMFGGFCFMPMALLLLSGDGDGIHSLLIGQVSTALAFLLVGGGVHITQTAGLALATDQATVESRPQVVSVMYMMQLLGMAVSSLVFGFLLKDFSAVKLIQVVQAAALVTAVLHIIALWKQEARNPAQTTGLSKTDEFSALWRRFMATPRAKRFLIAVGLGTAGFSMQDVILEPFGAEVLGMSVAHTTWLTAMIATGALLAFILAAKLLKSGFDTMRLSAIGMLVGLLALAAVVLAAPLQSRALLQVAALFIGFGGGLFAVGTLTAAMSFESAAGAGFAIGAWGAVQATAAGLAMGVGGVIRDAVAPLAAKGVFGVAMTGPATSYIFVYHLEILLLFVALAVIGPLASYREDERLKSPDGFSVPEFPR
jgi:MFS transporter, BCD family, chlorophyll transporter